MNLKDMFSMKLGFGGLRLPSLEKEENVDYHEMCEMVDYYAEQGGTYFDTSAIYHKGNSELAMAACVVDRLKRDTFCLADKLPTWNVKDYPKLEDIFRMQLTKCHVDYFDFYLLHNINSNSITYVKEHDEFSFLLDLKKKGHIRFAGFSFHDTPEMLDQLLTEYDNLDFVQLQINYYDWLSNYVNSKKCYEVAVKHKIPVIVMETVRGGGLSNLPQEAEELLRLVHPDMSMSSFAIRFAASLQNVIITLSGMTTLKQVQDNCSYMKKGAFKPLSDAEYEAVNQVRQLLWNKLPLQCQRCEQCEAVCPAHIPISKAISIYNDGQLFGNYNFPEMHYNIHMKKTGKAGDCTGCGACESVCPAQLQLKDTMRIISDLYDPKKDR